MTPIVIALLMTTLSGLSTIIGGIFVCTVRGFSSKYLSFLLGISAGSMIAISIADLLPTALKIVGSINALIFCVIGICIARLVDFAMPHHIKVPLSCTSKMKKLARTGSIVAIGMIIHNIPEGIAVFISALHDQKLGLILASATAIHNIPEGLAIATPIYCATKNKMTALKYTAIGGLAEPFGAIIAYLFLRPFLSPIILGYVYAAVAGIMLFISFDELIPWCFTNNHKIQAVAGIISGVMILSLSLWLL